MCYRHSSTLGGFDEDQRDGPLKPILFTHTDPIKIALALQLTEYSTAYPAVVVTFFC